MMTVERMITDIPENQVNEVVEDFESEGCSTTKIKQEDGLWTVKAECSE